MYVPKTLHKRRGVVSVFFGDEHARTLHVHRFACSVFGKMKTMFALLTQSCHSTLLHSISFRSGVHHSRERYSLLLQSGITK